MRVMFVDDEAQVLAGISRMLDAADVPWDVETAYSGSEALNAMEKEMVDVIVADMQMPEMDGGQLLDIVSQRYPDIVRIILSGQASKEAFYRAVTPMHQYLAKPCQADMLRETIERACALREILDTAKNAALLGKTLTLPSLPSLYQEVVAEMESDDCSVARIGKIVEQDPAMSAKLLQLANSAIFGLPTSVSSPAQAATMIGLDSMKALVLSIQVFKSFDGVSIPGFSIESVNAHSLEVANIARQIAKLEGFGNGEMNEAFTGGLLHDVGKLIFAAGMPGDFETAMAIGKDKGISQVAAETEVFGLGHDAMGSYLLALWGLPHGIVEAVAFHHRPNEFAGCALSPSAVVLAANYLVHESKGADTETEVLPCGTLPSELGEKLNDWRSAIEDSSW